MIYFERQMIFKGRVQGVGFRLTAVSLADNSRVRGSVRNLSDGSVEIYAQGTEKMLDTFVQLLKEKFRDHIQEVILVENKEITSLNDRFVILS